MTRTAARWAELCELLAGEILSPGDVEYDQARRVWNVAVDRHPAAIVRPAHEADVQAAVRFAAAHEVLLSVRGSGHHHAGYAVADSAAMIDLSGWRAVRIDPSSAP